MNSTARILIVDREGTQLTAALRAFRAAGYDTRDAHSGFAAVAEAREFAPDLIIIDAELPDMRGVDLCSHVRSIPALRHVIVLLMSGQATPSDIQIDGLAKGVDGFIHRHLASEELIARVGAYLRIKSAEDSFRLVDSRREELEKIVDHSRTVVVVCRNSEGWPVEFVSDSIAQFGYAPADFFTGGMNYLAIIHPSDADAVRARIASDIATGAHESESEYRILARDGAVRWVDVRTHLRRDEGGNIIDLQGILFDVTEKKLADEHIKQSERRFRTLFESANDAIVLVEDGRFVEFNKKAEELFGLAQEQLRGRTPFDVSPRYQPNGRTSEECGREYIQQVHAGRPQSFEWTHVRPDGTVFEVEISLNLVDLEDRKLLLAVIRDITERNRVMKALHDSESFNVAIAQTSPDFLTVFDFEKKRLIYQNRSIESVLGYTMKQLVAKCAGRLSLLIHPEDRLNVLRSFVASRNIIGGDPLVMEFRAHRKNFTHAWFQSRITGFQVGADGRNTQVLVVTQDVTRHKAAEQALRESRTRLEMALKGADLGFWEIEMRGGVFRASDRIANMLGYSSADRLDMSLAWWNDQVHPDDRDMVRMRLEKHVRGKSQVYESEHRLRTQSGDWTWVQDRGQIIERDREGTPVMAAGTMMHIHERKMAELESAESERRLRDVLEHVKLIAITLDPDGRITFCNDYFVELGGWKRDKLLGKNWFDFVVPENVRDEVRTHLRELIEGRATSPYFENEIMNAHGQHRWVRWTNILMRDTEHNVVGTASIGEDITDRKNAEKMNQAVYRISELVHAAQSLDDLYGSIHAVITELMPAKNLYIALYDEADNTFSFPYYVDEFDDPPAPYTVDRGLTAHVLRSGESLLTDPQLLNEMFQQGEIDYVGTVSFNWLGVPLKTKEKTIGVLAVQSYSMSVQYTRHQRDMLIFVSEQIAIAIESKRKEEELREAKEMAVASSRLKSSLLANMSHEFRTPMNGILGFADLLAMELRDPEQRQMAEVIRSSGRRLMDTLETILSLSIIESDRTKLQFEELDLAQEARHVVDPLRHEAESKGLFIDLERLTPVFASVDRAIFAHILRQLVQNAIKFTVTGGVTIGSHVEESGKGRRVVISVRDSGIGIAPEHHETIFKEFRQVSEGYGRSHEGIGLGLTLCRKMTEMMSGRIYFESKKMAGSTFSISFPAVHNPRTEPPALVVRETPIIVPTVRRTSGKMPRVLAVEDNEVNRDLLSIYLKSAYVVDAVPDAESALAMADKHQYDVILMDINLGAGMDGLHAAEVMRAGGKHTRTPIVAITGYAGSTDRKQLLEGGCSHYLAKPFDRSSLLALLDTICGAATEGPQP